MIWPFVIDLMRVCSYSNCLVDLTFPNTHTIAMFIGKPAIVVLGYQVFKLSLHETCCDLYAYNSVLCIIPSVFRELTIQLTRNIHCTVGQPAKKMTIQWPVHLENPFCWSVTKDCQPQYIVAALVGKGRGSRWFWPLLLSGNCSNHPTNT